MIASEPFVGDDVKIQESLLGRAVGYLLVNEDQVFYHLFQRVRVVHLAATIASRVITIVLVKDAGITFRSENIGVAERFVADDRLEWRGISVVIFHEGDRIKWIASGKPSMIKRR